MQSLWLVNGQQTGLDPADRGLAYGDGLFETMAARDGTIRWLEQHLDRLEEGCRRLQIAPPARRLLTEEIAAHSPRTGRAVVKLIVTRGSGARGYMPPADSTPTRVLSVTPWPDHPRSHYDAGIRVRVCRLRLAANPALGGLKHLNRLEHVLASLELRGTDAHQGVLLDTADAVVGGTSSNVFAVQGGRLLTPALTRAGVRGVMRRVVLATAIELGIEAVERELAVNELERADELFMTNAVFGIWPVAALGDRTFTRGAVTRQLMQHLGVGADA